MPRTWRRTCTGRCGRWTDLRGRDGGGEPGDAAEAGSGAGGPGLRLHGACPRKGICRCGSGRSSGRAVVAVVFVVLNVRSSGRARCTKSMRADSSDFDLVLHRRAAAGLWRADLRRRDCAELDTRRSSRRCWRAARGRLVGRAADGDRGASIPSAFAPRRENGRGSGPDVSEQPIAEGAI